MSTEGSCITETSSCSVCLLRVFGFFDIQKRFTIKIDFILFINRQSHGVLGFWTFGYLQNSLFWSDFCLGFSNMQAYVHIFKVQLLFDQVHGRFLQYLFLKVVIRSSYSPC